MAEHGALRPARRAGRVADQRRVTGRAAVELPRIAVGQTAETRIHDDHPGVGILDPASPLVVVDDRQPGAGVVHDVGDLRRPVRRVHRHDDEAGAQATDMDGDEVDGRPHAQHDPVAGDEPTGRQPARRDPGPVLDLGPAAPPLDRVVDLRPSGLGGPLGGPARRQRPGGEQVDTVGMQPIGEVGRPGGGGHRPVNQGSRRCMPGLMALRRWGRFSVRTAT